jgi:1,4-dihydroxy-2-naphthoyl-CoA hydrolase
MGRDDATTSIHRAMPFTATLGIRGVREDPREVQLALDWAPSLCTAGGVLHGGVLMALADSAGAACAFANLPAGATGTATIESKSNFFAAVRGGTVTATARPLHVGGSVIVVETEIRDDAGKLVAKVTQTQAVLRARPFQ